MNVEQQGPSEFWMTFLGENGPLCGLAIETLANNLKPGQIEVALAALAREESIGPVFNPSAYLDGRRWTNARLMKAVLVAAGDLVHAELARREEWR
jgi:hypothetical protein